MPKQDEKPPLFIHSALDEAGLDLYEFRLLAHVARRGDCYAAVPKIAQVCKMSHRKVQVSLKSLMKKGLIAQQLRPGKTSIYRLSSEIWDWLTAYQQENLKIQKAKQAALNTSAQTEFVEKKFEPPSESLPT